MAGVEVGTVVFQVNPGAGAIVFADTTGAAGTLQASQVFGKSLVGEWL